MSTKNVTLAYPYTDAKGKEHDADETLALPAAEANELVAKGLARPDSEATPKSTQKRAPRKRAAKKATAPEPAVDNDPADPATETKGN